MQQFNCKILKISVLSLFGISLSVNTLFSQKAKTVEAPNLIIITTDGFRWQEVFGGMDSTLANNKKFNQGDSAYIYNKYGATTVAEQPLS